MKKQNRLILIDGSAYIFRAYYALPPMSRADGTPVNAVFGFTNMLVKLIEDYSQEKLVVIFDAARENFRNKIYPGAKAQNPDPRTTDDKFLMEVVAGGDHSNEDIMALLKETGAIEVSVNSAEHA